MRRLWFAAMLALLPIAAHAQTMQNMDVFMNRFRDATAAWEAPLARLALGTFALLCLIDVALVLIRQALRGGAGLSDYIEAVVHEILRIGIFAWCITQYQIWNPIIVRSFRYAAGQASGLQLMTPSDIMAVGINAFNRIASKVTILDPGPSFVIGLCGIAVLIIFGLLCCTIMLALIQGYFVSGAGVLFMCAGGSRISQDLALAVVRATLAVGARIFALQMIIALGMAFIDQWLAEFTQITLNTVGIMLAQCLVLLVISWRIPLFIEQMVGGFGFAGAGEVFGAAAGVANTAATGVRTVAAPSAAIAAVASRGMAAIGNATSRASGALGNTMRGGGNLGGGAAGTANIGARLGGRRR